jgi:predicted nucleic acid-binding protein
VNRALLDTDTYSEVLKAVNPTVAQNAATYRQRHGRYSVSVISVMENVHGFQLAQNERRLQGFLAAVASEEVIPFEHAAAELAGRIAGDLDRTGQTIGKADPMIAATALQHGLELVTGNTRITSGFNNSATRLRLSTGVFDIYSCYETQILETPTRHENRETGLYASPPSNGKAAGP